MAAAEATTPTAGTYGPETTVVLDDVDVTYHVQGDQRPRIKDVFTRSDDASRRNVRQIHAVRGVSLAASRGEAIGLIGQNGSGKSTLLRAMAGLLPPSSGAVYATSQPTLLGVGAALQSNISGRRNIVLGGLALGLSRDEVEERMDEIVHFAGLEGFIDVPLRAYSSGMRARLLFSISTAVHPEILLIDEALAVGDEIFRNRSQRRINELLDEAGTVFIVSHSSEAILEMCNRVMWLDQGELQADGEPEDVVRQYRTFVRQSN